MEEKTVATVNWNSPNEDYICSSGGEKLHTEMFVQPKARSASTGVGSCQRRYRIVNFYHSWGGERDRYAAQLLCRTAADAVIGRRGRWWRRGVGCQIELLTCSAAGVDSCIYLSFILLNTGSSSLHTCYCFSGFTLLTSTLPLQVKGHTPGLLWIRYPPVATQIHSAPPHAAATPRHTAVTEPELILNPSAGEPIPAPDGKWGQMKTKCPSCFIHQDSLVKKALHLNVLLNLFHQLQWKQTEADAEQWCPQEGT